jgi:FKBP-type peptidyl-prolyl cis-trans isomerase SlyD
MFEESATNLELGQQYEIELDEGTLSVIAVEIDEEHVTVDGNHPLTGIDLNFDITVREVREATAEEIAHGHAHGAGGCEG